MSNKGVDIAMEPLVSICCLSYNHAAFISGCLDGFLTQETTFGIEILIHDDASTDGTDKIIKEYAEKYPNKIFPLFEEKNQYSNGFKGKMDITFNYSRARGKYIATCEGDDYWTDPYKLQRQVEFLESHPEYSVCFHRCKHQNDENGSFSDDNCGFLFQNGEVGVDISLDMYFQSWITQPLTMVFRKSMFSAEWQKRYKYYRDMHEIFHLLSVGKGYIFAFEGGVYRYHPGGINSMISKVEYCRVSLPMDREFYRKNRVEGTKRIYCETLQDAVNVCCHSNKLEAFWYALVQFTMNGKIKTFGKNLRIIINGHF